MGFIEDDIREILIKKPSECAYLDYKIVPYNSNNKHDFVKDVIAMLNSEEAIGKDKFIVFGVEDKCKYQKGIDLEAWLDDNAYQNWIDNIEPRPQLQSGTLEFEDKVFGYVYISKENKNRVYEVGKTIVADVNSKPSEKSGAYRGQAYIRQGSRNSILMQQQRISIFQQKIQKENVLDNVYGKNPVDVEFGYTKAFGVALMVGQWNEEYEGDIQIIEALVGIPYEAFIAIIHNLHAKYSQQITITNKIWKINLNYSW